MKTKARLHKSYYSKATGKLVATKPVGPITNIDVTNLDRNQFKGRSEVPLVAPLLNFSGDETSPDVSTLRPDLAMHHNQAARTPNFRGQGNAGRIPKVTETPLVAPVLEF